MMTNAKFISVPDLSGLENMLLDSAMQMLLILFQRVILFIIQYYAYILNPLKSLTRKCVKSIFS